MPSKNANAMALVALTTGAGIVVGTNVELGGIYIGSAATTVTVKGGAAGTTSQLELTASIDFFPPIAISGPVTATSSGGSFAIAYRNR